MYSSLIFGGEGGIPVSSLFLSIDFLCGTHSFNGRVSGKLNFVGEHETTETWDVYTHEWRRMFIAEENPFKNVRTLR